MSKSDRWQTRLDPDDSQCVETYRDDRDLSNSEAVRRLIRAGLDTEAREEAMPDGGEVIDRIDELEAQQKQAQRATAVRDVSTLAGVIVVLAYFGDLAPAAPTAAVAVLLLVVQVAAAVYGGR